MMDSELRERIEGLVQMELAMLTTGVAMLGRWSEVVIESERAAAERLSALAREEKPVYPDSYESAAADMFTLWRDTVRHLSTLPRLAGMCYFAELAKGRGQPPSEEDARGS